MLGRLWRLARGQVRVRVTGASLPRFLNLCAFHSLTLRRMKRTAWNELYATMSVEDFRALRRYMGRTGCRVHIVRRRGAPFAAARIFSSISAASSGLSFKNWRIFSRPLATFWSL